MADPAQLRAGSTAPLLLFTGSTHATLVQATLVGKGFEKTRPPYAITARSRLQAAT